MTFAGRGAISVLAKQCAADEYSTAQQSKARQGRVEWLIINVVLFWMQRRRDDHSLHCPVSARYDDLVPHFVHIRLLQLCSLKSVQRDAPCAASTSYHTRSKLRQQHSLRPGKASSAYLQQGSPSRVVAIVHQRRFFRGFSVWCPRGQHGEQNAWATTAVSGCSLRSLS